MAKKPFVPFFKKFGEDKAKDAKDGKEGKPKMKKFAAGGQVARGSGCAVKGNTFTRNG